MVQIWVKQDESESSHREIKRQREKDFKDIRTTD